MDDRDGGEPGGNIRVAFLFFSQTVEILEGGVLTSLMNQLPQPERYSYVFEGNSQVLDQIVVSDTMLELFAIEYDVVHVNAEFAAQASDHDPQARGSTSAAGRSRRAGHRDTPRCRTRRLTPGRV